MSIIPTPSFKSREHCPSHQTGQRQKYLIIISKQKPSEECLCQMPMKLSLSEIERIDLIFFPFSRFLLWQNDTFFIQSLKQKNDWRSNEGQIVFQPADAVADRLKTLQQNGWTKGLALKTLWATFPEKKTSSYSLCSQNTHVKRTLQGVVLLSPKVPSFPLCQLKYLVTFILGCCRFPGLTPLLDSGFISHQHQIPQGICFSLSLNAQMLSLNVIWKYMVFLTKS